MVVSVKTVEEKEGKKRKVVETAAEIYEREVGSKDAGVKKDKGRERGGGKKVRRK